MNLSLKTIIISIVFAGIGAVGISIYTTQSIDRYASWLLDERRFISYTPRTIENNSKNNLNSSLEAVHTNAKDSIVYFTNSNLSSSTQASGLQGEGSVQGVGIVVSADGWVLTGINPDGLVGWINGNRYEFSQTASDSRSSAFLVKLKDADNLRSINFGNSTDKIAGAILFAVGGQDQISAFNLISSHLALSSKPVNPGALNQVWAGNTFSPLAGLIFNDSGDLIGLQTELGIIPLNDLNKFVESTLRSSSLQYATVNITTLSLASFSNLDAALRGNRTQGEIVFASTVPEILPQDIITAVDDENITDERSLADLLLSYSPGQSASFTIIRSGQTVVVPVTFTAWE